VPTSTIPHFFYRPDALPAAQLACKISTSDDLHAAKPKVLKTSEGTQNTDVNEGKSPTGVIIFRSTK